MRFADRVKQTTTSTSAAIIVLSGTVATFGTFPAAFEVGTTGIVACTDDGKGAWEISAYTLTNASTLTRTAILSSSNNGAAVTFAAGVKEVFSTLPAAALAEFLRLSDGITVAGLPRGVPQATDLFPFARAAGGDLAITYGDFLALVNGNPPASDTTAPSFPDALTSSAVTQNGFTLAWQAATDASGISRYEYSYDGSTWTTAGTALSVVLTGRTAGTTYTMRVRALDPSGNPSVVRTLAVTTAAASGDTQVPVMSGSISTSNITSSGYTFGWTAGIDNVGIDHYETSIDGGATWQTIAAGTLSRAVTNRPASTTDNLRVRAHDGAGNISNVLSGTATTSAAAPEPIGGWPRFVSQIGLTESGTGPYTYAGSDTGNFTSQQATANKLLGAAGVDGSLSVKFEQVAGNGMVFGLSSSATYTALSNIVVQLNITGGVYSNSSSASPVNTGANMAPAEGDILRIRRAGTAVYAEVARAATPTNFTLIVSWPNVNAVNKYFSMVIASDAKMTPLEAVGLV